MISNCNEISKNKIISISENNMKFVIKNKSNFKINKVFVDSCYIKSGLKCDYLFEIIHIRVVNRVLYVELKGKNIEHAIKQLQETINHCKTIHINIHKESYIIASKIPRASVASQILKKRFKAKNNIQLFIDTKYKEIYL